MPEKLKKARKTINKQVIQNLFKSNEDAVCMIDKGTRGQQRRHAKNAHRAWHRSRGLAASRGCKKGGASFGKRTEESVGK